MELPEGWFSPADIEFYREIYTHLVPVTGRTAEIGCHRGRSICCVSDIIRDRCLSVVCVDPWEIWEHSSQDASDKEAFFREVARFGICAAVETQITHSLDAAGLYGREFDFVFIDADHEYKSVNADIQAWESKVKPGGYLGGHDFHDFPGVTTAVLERYGMRTKLRMDSSIWLVQL